MTSRRGLVKACLLGPLLGITRWARAASRSKEAAELAPSPGERHPSPVNNVSKESIVTKRPNASVESALNVKDFGAVGNGIADDTFALRAAIAQAMNTGRTVYIPAGRYLITDTLQLSFDYSPSATELENNVIAMSLTGDGPHATYILWGGRVPITVAKKPMLFIQGYIGLRRLTLMGMRQYLGTGYHTPYYGIVGNGTLWKNAIEDVDIKYVCVCFSAAVVATYRPQGPHGFEVDPRVNGLPFDTDFAQIQFRNCVFCSEVTELFDGSLHPATALDSTGSRLLEMSCSFEAARQQSVNIEFDSCSLQNNNKQARGTVRLNDAGDIRFKNTMLSAPPTVSAHTYSIYELSPSGGSNVYLEHCYLDGGIAHMSTSQGILRIRNCNGENATADVAYKGIVELFHIGGFGTTVDIDGLDIGRGDFLKQLTLSVAAQQRSSATNPASDTSATLSRRLYSLRNITGVTQIQCGHEVFPPSARVDSSPSLVPDYAPATSVRRMLAPFLCKESSDWDPALGFSSTAQVGGRWLHQATLDTANELSCFVAVNPSTCYDFSVDVHIGLAPYQRPQGGELVIQVTFHDTNKALIGAGAGSGIFLLGGIVPTNGYDQLRDGQTVTLYSQHIVPPATAAYARIQLQANPTSRRYVLAAVGNVLFGPAGSNVLTPLYPPQRYSAASVPLSGNWNRGDFVLNSAPVPKRDAAGSYITTGWLRLTTGSAHELGTDWAEAQAHLRS